MSQTATPTALDIATDLIQRHEGLQLAVYLDPVGIETVGWGHVVQPLDRLSLGQKITQERADALFTKDLARARKGLAEAVLVPLSPEQEAALISWAFNVGVAGAKASTLIRQLNAGDPWSVPDELRRWVHAGDRELPGLVKRREEEAALFAAGTPPKPATLRRGDKGPEVAQLQEVLIRLGHLSQRARGSAIGMFGPATEKAIKSFQASAGVVVDGVAGPQTRAALEAAQKKGIKP